MTSHLLLAMAVAISLTSDGSRPRMCSEKSLFTSLNVLGVECDLAGIEERLEQFGPSNTHSLADLAKVAESYGTYPSVVQLRDLDELRPAAIVHVKGKAGHFLTFLGFEGRDVVLGDAPIPPVRVDRRFFLEQWSGNVVLIFTTASEREAYRLRLLTNKCLFVEAILWPVAIICVVCFRRWDR